MRVLEKIQASFRVSKRLMTSITLVLLILVTMVWVSCGGTDTESDPTTVPSTQVGSTNPVTDVPTDGSRASSTGTDKLFLSADQFDDVKISLTAGDVLKVTYSSSVSISPGLGGTSHQERGVLLAVLDPQGEQLLTAEEMAMNTIEVTAQMSGEHEIVFINPNKLEGLNVDVEYSINP